MHKDSKSPRDYKQRMHETSAPSLEDREAGRQDLRRDRIEAKPAAKTRKPSPQHRSR